MIKFFAYDNTENNIIVNEPEILLIKEFADLWTDDRNKCKEDPTGKKRLKAFRELVYIYLAIDWGAPGSKDTPENRKQVALEASKLTEDEFNDPVFLAACKKYQELQDKSSTVGPMIQMFRNKLHEIKLFMERIDYNERTETGMPVFKVKDTFDVMKQLSQVLESLKVLEAQYKEEQDEVSGLRGDTMPGMHD